MYILLFLIYTKLAFEIQLSLYICHFILKICRNILALGKTILIYSMLSRKSQLIHQKLKVSSTASYKISKEIQCVAPLDFFHSGH